jgi:uncharacterized protein YraI
MKCIIIVFTILLEISYEMTKNWFQLPTFLAALFLIGLLFASNPTVGLAQQPTETPASSTGLFITVLFDEPEINVRMGPNSSIYPIVGKLPAGATAPALGRSQGGDWIQIEFPGAPNNRGWVYSPLVQVSPPGNLQIVESPPTPVPPPTATFDPTLVAQFSIQPTSTRLPTFTPPPELTHPAYATTSSAKETIPVGTIIIALAILGLIGFPLSLIRR